MTCPSCQMDNPQEAAFCGRCGTRLAVPVPAQAVAAQPIPAMAVSVTPGVSNGASAVPPLTTAQVPSPLSVPPTSLPPAFALATLICVAGPDQGKRLAVGPDEATLGTAAERTVVSADPEVGPDHAGFLVSNGVLHFRIRGAAPVFVANAPTQQGTLAPGTAIRIGHSEWRVEDHRVHAHFDAHTMSDIFDRVGTNLGAVAGVGRLEGFQAREMFSSLKDKHSEEDVEEYFITGTRSTTPMLAQIQAVWPKPWVFFKIFTALLVVFVGCAFGVLQFGNENFLPGLMVVGSFVIPISVLLFYFEMNIPRNVSIYQVFRMVFIGGTLSLVVALFGYKWTTAISFIGGFLPGIVEEVGKVAALIFVVVGNRRYPWTLNGLLLGGAVGAGFAGFESAGYAFQALTGDGGGGQAMLHSIIERGLLAPGGHVAWAALNGAALWKVKGDQPFAVNMLTDIRFLRVLGLTMLLHGLWDSIGSLPVFAVLIFVALLTVLMFVQDGIKQVQRAQVEAGVAAPGVPA